jgi:hypothetical protein
MSKLFSRVGWWRGFAVAGALIAVASEAGAQSTPAIPIAPQAAPHPLAQGMTLVDRSGVAVGVIAAVADSERGPMVVVKIEGKLLSIPQATLTLDGTIVRSSQTKAQILAAIAAP